MLQVKYKRCMGNASREWLEAPTPNLQMQVFVKRFQIVLSQSKTTLTTLTRSPAFSVFFNQEKQTTQGVFATATVVRNLEKRFYLLKIPAGCLLLRYESNIKKGLVLSCHAGLVHGLVPSMWTREKFLLMMQWKTLIAFLQNRLYSTIMPDSSPGVVGLRIKDKSSNDLGDQEKCKSEHVK